MAYEKRPDTGTLGKNKRKEKDSHPDYSGQINVAGVDYWLSGWLKTGPTGEKFFSLAVKPKEQEKPKQKGEEYAGGLRQPAVGEPDDDLPF